MRWLVSWFHDRWGWRIAVWWYERRSVEVRVRRSCGHHEDVRLLRKGIELRLGTYQATPCPECLFYETLRGMKEKYSTHP